MLLKMLCMHIGALKKHMNVAKTGLRRNDLINRMRALLTKFTLYVFEVVTQFGLEFGLSQSSFCFRILCSIRACGESGFDHS